MNIAEKIILELHYLPSIQFFSKFLLHQEVWIEQHEHYQKGSFRNRAHIASANGLLRLSIPLIKGKHQQQAIREVRIAYHEPWRQQHWQSIRSAYGSAPFFDHYSDELRPLFRQKETFLFDFNLKLIQTLLSLLSIDKEIHRTHAYEKKPPADFLDFRDELSPKKASEKNDPHYKCPKYVQVFEEKHGFLPNLSILDLLFCMGPEAAMLLEQSIIRN